MFMKQIKHIIDGDKFIVLTSGIMFGALTYSIAHLSNKYLDTSIIPFLFAFGCLVVPTVYRLINNKYAITMAFAIIAAIFLCEYFVLNQIQPKISRIIIICCFIYNMFALIAGIRILNNK